MSPPRAGFFVSIVCAGRRATVSRDRRLEGCTDATLPRLDRRYHDGVAVRGFAADVLNAAHAEGGHMWRMVLVGGALCAAVAALSGCATRSFVEPIGNGVFQVAGKSPYVTSGAEEKAHLVKAADRYCARHAKSATVVGSGADDARAGTLAAPGTQARAYVRFRCE